ncbi:hypothetical protein H6B07_20215, partial [Mediterraneibacter glycyrrhizinilyticus]
ACEQEIAEQDRKIQEYERAYESLRRFDGAVDTAQSNFHNVNTAKVLFQKVFFLIPTLILLPGRILAVSIMLLIESMDLSSED